MFIGHFAAALAGKRAAPKAPLALLVFSSFWIDLLWPPLLLLGVEEVRIDPGITVVTPLDFVSYPVSHSLAAVMLWGGAVGLLAAWRWRDVRTALAAGSLVVSHWVLDWVTHRPDLALWPGGPKVGLGLWNSLSGTLAVEASLFALGLWLYLGVTRPSRPKGRWVLLALNLFFVLVWLGNMFGPPPPSTVAIAVSAMALWLLVPWAAWVDRHRGLAPEFEGRAGG